VTCGSSSCTPSDARGGSCADEMAAARDMLVDLGVAPRISAASQEALAAIAAGQGGAPLDATPDRAGPAEANAPR
jgi:hypothetical protein